MAGASKGEYVRLFSLSGSRHESKKRVGQKESTIRTITSKYGQLCESLVSSPSSTRLSTNSNGPTRIKILFEEIIASSDPQEVHVLELFELLEMHINGIDSARAPFLSDYSDCLRYQKIEKLIVNAALTAARIICLGPPAILESNFIPDVNLHDPHNGNNIRLDGLLFEPNNPNYFSLAGSLLGDCQTSSGSYSLVEIKTAFDERYALVERPQAPITKHLNQLVTQVALYCLWWTSVSDQDFKFPSEIILVYLRGFYDHLTYRYPVDSAFLTKWLSVLNDRVSSGDERVVRVLDQINKNLS